MKAWKHVKTMVNKPLASYPTTFDEDVEILKKSDLKFNKKMAVIFRKNEKNLLHYFAYLADKVVQLSTLTKKEAKQEISKWGNEKHYHPDCKVYFNTVFIPMLAE